MWQRGQSREVARSARCNRWRLGGLLLVALAGGCGSEAAEPAPPPIDEEPVECVPGERTLDDGGCQPAGVPPERCAEGFEPDDAMGCVPVLPEPCGPGTMAVPGEPECRELAPCGDGPWGEIPVEPGTQFVDRAYGGADSDGSEARPWTTIGEAFEAAAPGAIIAVAAGSYQEDLLLFGKAVRLWGRCPAMVEIVGSGADIAAVFVRGFADGLEIHDLAVRSPTTGISLAGSLGLLLDRVWIHDTGDHGLDVVDFYAPTEATVRGSLIEGSVEAEVYVWGSQLRLERSVLRGPPLDGSSGARGLNAQYFDEDGVRPQVTVVSSVIEQSREVGIFAGAADLSVDASVVRLVRPTGAGHGGRAIDGVDHPALGERSTVLVQGSLVERHQETGINLTGSDGTIEATVIRAAEMHPTLGDARGIAAQVDVNTGQRSSVTLHECLIADSFGVGVHASDSDAWVEGVLVRDTRPAADGRAGWGVGVQTSPIGEPGRSVATLRWVVAEGNHEAGMVVIGSDATIEQSAVRQTQPVRDDLGGRGIAVSIDPLSAAPASAIVRDVLVEQNLEVGILVSGSDASIERATVRHIASNAAGWLGDGVAVVSLGLPASVEVLDSAIAHCERAGLLSFGAFAAAGATSFECTTFDLDGEVYAGQDHDFEDRGGNRCGCEGATHDCAVVTSNLEPPEPITD